jgi:hypothetical protein
MDKNEIQRRILEEEDYVRCPKLGNSLNKFTAKNHEGVENATIARLLLMSEEEVDRVYQEAVAELRRIMVENE